MKQTPTLVSTVAPTPTADPAHGTAPPPVLQWRLFTVMAENDIRTATELTRRLQARGISISKQQVSRLVAAKQRPARLNLALLEALMVELNCSADALLRTSTVARKPTRRGQILTVAPPEPSLRDAPEAQLSALAPRASFTSPIRTADPAAGPGQAALAPQHDASQVCDSVPGAQTPPRRALPLEHALGPRLHSLGSRSAPPTPETKA